MKQASTRLSRGLIAASLAAGVIATTATQAQSSTPTPATASRPQLDIDGAPGMRGRSAMMELERLKSSLRLDGAQTALWDRARSLMNMPGGQRETMRGRRERLAAMLDDPAFDPRKLSAEMDGNESERRAGMTGMREAWFAVYDSLNPVQRGQAREFLRSHMRRLHGGGPDVGHLHGRDREPDPRPGSPAPR